jgi:ribosomal protein S20
VEVPQIKLPPVPIASAAARPRREKRRTTKTPATPALVQTPEADPVVSAAAAKDAAVGALTGGGESNPQARQEAADLIASIEKRLNALPTQMTDEEKTQVSKVRNFWRDAQGALTSGDAEGAKTLATKAKLLLDDLEK